MFVNNLKFALRNITRNRVFSAINITGLAVSLTAFILMALYIENELGFDRFHPKASRIYRVADDKQTPDIMLRTASSAAPVAPALLADFPEIEQAVRIIPGESLVSYGNKIFEERSILFADVNFFQVFGFNMISGNASDALKNPGQIVITENIRQKYFGKEDALGKTLLFDGKNMKVSGVVENVPADSHLSFDVLISMATAQQAGSGYEWLFTNWYSNNFYTYLLLPERYSAGKLSAGLEAFEVRHREPGSTTRHHYALEPLTQIYLRSDRSNQIGKTGSLTNLYIFSAVALFILLLACVNFINLSTATAARRAKEVAVKKVAGAARSQVIVQFFTESFITTAIGLVIAICLASLVMHGFSDFAGKTLHLQLFNPVHAGAAFILLAVIGILAGTYPAFILSGFKPATALKGKVPVSLWSLGIRKGLVVFQFAVSVVLIICSLVVYRQLNYMQSQDLGFKPAQSMVINFEGDGAVQKQYNALRQQLLGIPGVQQVTASSSVPGDGKTGGWSMEFKKKTGESIGTELPVYVADVNFLQQYQIPVVAGRGFSTMYPADTVSSMMVNEAFLKKLGFNRAEDAIDIVVDMYPTKGKIIGVFKDFHFESLQKAIGPLTMRVMPDKFRLLSIQMNASDIRRTIGDVERIWKQVVPQRPIEYSFLDESFNRQYEASVKFGKVFAIFTALAILIACLGLFGLALFSTQQRTKEIGIRKVLGADITGIAAMLSKDYVKLVVISLFIASPIAWYTMSGWLEGYSYRTSLDAWIFIVASVLAVSVALLTVLFQAIHAAMANPVRSLRAE